MKVLIADKLAEEGINILRPHAEVDVKTGLKPEELIAIIGDYDALIVRSQTQVTADVIKAGKKLQVVARAGVGVDNVDIDEATQHGIIVVNAPTGNTISAAEHTIALMLALARNIPQANTMLRGGVWKRSAFMGTEVRNKTLGILGLGNVGSEVAKRARGLQMKLIGHDPFISVEHASNLQVELVPIKQLLKESDFITLHMPLTSSTKGMIGAKELATVKPTARIINTARGGLIDEEALAKAIKEKKLAGAAIDVFPTEPCTRSILFEDDSIIVTPHLGASTTEAQAMAASDVAEQVVDILHGKPPRYPVNAPFIPSETLSALAPFMKVAATLGRLVGQLAEGQTNSVQIKYEGEISNYDTNSLKAAVLGGLLEGISEERVNLVNANIVAARRGLTVVEQKETACENYASLITVEVTTSAGATIGAGTVIHGESHIVRVNNFWMDIVPTGGYFLFCDHKDRPGLIGAAGNITGAADINVSAMHLSRLKPRGEALMILALDEPLPEEKQQEIMSLDDVYSVKQAKL
ncbi:MAG TPA: phosphoglycerate dehydrogenase [Dehalococcoidales bacterium]|nr:phosphoglycerate dehydrogenase [Dehalococcoidales bacterium]